MALGSFYVRLFKKSFRHHLRGTLKIIDFRWKQYLFLKEIGRSNTFSVISFEINLTKARHKDAHMLICK